MLTEAPSIVQPPARYEAGDVCSQETPMAKGNDWNALEVEACKVLAERVEHVADTQGDGPSFDVLSFEESGRERLIEVKTTAFGKLTPFYVSRNELARSRADADLYQIYRVFGFRDRPKLFSVPGAIEAASTWRPSRTWRGWKADSWQCGIMADHGKQRPKPCLALPCIAQNV